jgi:UDP-N-acetylglucosamine 2-epimerase (non-hydrolysing)
MGSEVNFLHLVGARPNFVKLAPVYRALREHSAEQFVVHTGQHYDDNMSKVFFEQLSLPNPDQNLEVGSGSHAQQTSRILALLEETLLRQEPDCVIVYGDVNSTLAGALAAATLSIPVAHVEAGLRSFDRSMPEELNRVVVDHIAEILFAPSEDARENLLREGIEEARIELVGNVMVDSLLVALPQITSVHLPKLPSRFVLVTLHRPTNVDDSHRFQQILEHLRRINEVLPVVFSLHPRTRPLLERAKIGSPFHILPPLGYLDFLAIQNSAAAVITDSGGLQEETTVLGVPCLTLRSNTERPVTVTHGTNRVVQNIEDLQEALQTALHSKTSGIRPRLWDGRTGSRIARILVTRFPR